MATVLVELQKLYKPPRTFLTWKTPLELLIATILSAQCTDAQVNKITPALFKKYKRPEDYLKVPVEDLEADIHSCGTFHNKAKFIRALCGILIDQFKGKVPDTMEELIALPGVGRKTAAVVLYACFGKIEGIAVDTHVLRLSQRLGLTTHSTPEKIELDLMKQTPKEQWGRVTTLLISHGRAVCMARDRKCEKCVFQAICPSSLMRGKRDVAKK